VIWSHSYDSRSGNEVALFGEWSMRKFLALHGDANLLCSRRKQANNLRAMACDKLLRVDDVSIHVVNATFNGMTEARLNYLPIKSNAFQ